MSRYNSDLFNYHSENLEKIKKTFEHEVDFLDMVLFLQYNVPVGEYKKLCLDGPWDKKTREYNPVSGKFESAIDLLALLDRYIENFHKVLDKGYSFVFYGGNGSGKSMAALYVLCRLVDDGYNGYYINFKEYMTLFNVVQFKDDAKLHKPVLKHIYDCELLVVDELGKESNTTPNVIGELENLVKYRVARNLPTILVCNIPFADGESSANQTFLEKYGNSVFSVLKEKFKIFNFSSKQDYRALSRSEWDI